MLFPFHKCFNVLAFQTLLALVSALPDTSLIPPEIVNAVAPCSLSCLASFITDVFSPIACSIPPTLDCLCSRYQNAGLALGDASLTCYYTSCINQTIPTVNLIYDFCARVIATVIATPIYSTTTATLSSSTSTSQVTAQDFSSSSSTTSTTAYPASIIDSGATVLGASLLTASPSISTTTLQASIFSTVTQSSTSPTPNSGSAATVGILTPGQIAGVTVAAVFTSILVFFLLGSIAACIQRRQKGPKQRKPPTARWRQDKIPGPRLDPGNLANNLGTTGIPELPAAYPKLQEAGAGIRVDPSKIGLAVSPEVGYGVSSASVQIAQSRTKLLPTPPRAMFSMKPQNFSAQNLRDSTEAHRGSEVSRSPALSAPQAISLYDHPRSSSLPAKLQGHPITVGPEVTERASSVYIPPKFHLPVIQPVTLPAPLSSNVTALHNSPYGSIISLYQSPLSMSPQSKFSAHHPLSNVSMNGGRRIRQSYIPDYYTRKLDLPAGPSSFQQSPVMTLVSQPAPANPMTHAVQKMTRESSTSETSFESVISSEATPPEEETKQIISLTPINEFHSPLAGLRYPNIPRPSNQAIARPAPSPTKLPIVFIRPNSGLAQQKRLAGTRDLEGDLETTQHRIQKLPSRTGTENIGWPTRTSSRTGIGNEPRRNTKEMVMTSPLWEPKLTSRTTGNHFVIEIS